MPARCLGLERAGDRRVHRGTRTRLPPRRGGLTVDMGQQAFLSCCSAYRGLRAKLGMTDHAQLQDGVDVTVLFWPNGSRFPPPRRR
jgi:hypothetical protein